MTPSELSRALSEIKSMYSDKQRNAAIDRLKARLELESWELRQREREDK